MDEPVPRGQVGHDPAAPHRGEGVHGLGVPAAGQEEAYEGAEEGGVEARLGRRDHRGVIARKRDRDAAEGIGIGGGRMVVVAAAAAAEEMGRRRRGRGGEATDERGVGPVSEPQIGRAHV